MTLGSELRIVFRQALALALSVFCVAAQADELIDKARGLLAARDAKAAFELLSPREPERAGNPEFDHLLGVAALDSGQPTRAIFALERVLVAQPDNAVARADIARAYLAVGETETARREFAQVRSGQIPPDAARRIDGYLDAIGRMEVGKSTQLRAFLEVALGYDSNVNGTTGSSQIAIPALGGLVVTLDPDGVKRGDAFGSVGGGANLRVPIRPDLAFVATASFASIMNRDEERFDTATIDASAGLSWTAGAHALGIGLQGNRFLVDDNRYRDVSGAVAQWQYNVRPNTQIGAFGQMARVSYPSQSIRDADRAVMGFGAVHAFAPGSTIVYGSLYVGREDERATGVPHLGHELAGVRTGAHWKLAQSMTLFADATFEQRRYGGAEPFFLETRRDEQASLTLGMHYAVAKDWRVTPQVGLTRNRSNIPLYDYSRSVASVALRREF